MAGVSRTDLLAWLNDLLQINYTKIEQCGSGGAYCQVLDTIYSAIFDNHGPLPDFHTSFARTGDVPMNRVKMNARHEYEFVANYKVMQNVFKAHKIEKVASQDTICLDRGLIIVELANTRRKASQVQNAVRPKCS